MMLALMMIVGQRAMIPMMIAMIEETMRVMMTRATMIMKMTKMMEIRHISQILIEKSTKDTNLL